MYLHEKKRIKKLQKLKIYAIFNRLLYIVKKLGSILTLGHKIDASLCTKCIHIYIKRENITEKWKNIVTVYY